MRAVIDTNILIDYLAGVEAARDELARHADASISAITWIVHRATRQPAPCAVPPASRPASCTARHASLPAAPYWCAGLQAGIRPLVRRSPLERDPRPG